MSDSPQSEPVPAADNRLFVLVLQHPHEKREPLATAPTKLQRWALQTEQRRGHNVATVAVANKLARIVWAVWTSQQPFTAEHRHA